MSDERLAELRALSDAATPGPWAINLQSPDLAANIGNAEKWVCAVTQEGGHGDIDFIAASRTAIPELLDEIKRLRECLSNIDGGYYAGLATQSE